MKSEESGKKKRLEFTAKFIESVKPSDKEERYTDVKIPGLTFAVYPPSPWKPNGSKKWRYRYMFAGKAKMLSLGDYPTVSLKEAREKAFEARKLVDEGIDPSQERKAEKQGQALSTFREITEAWLDDRTENKWEASHAKRNRERFSP